MSQNYKYLIPRDNLNIWWNNDTVDKPSGLFFEKISWDVLNNNTNINFISLLNASITVNKFSAQTFKYLRVSETTKDRYYFVSNVEMETAQTITYSLELDVWATYIMKKYYDTTATFDRLLYNKSNDDLIDSKQRIGFNELPFDYYNLTKHKTKFSLEMSNSGGESGVTYIWARRQDALGNNVKISSGNVLIPTNLGNPKPDRYYIEYKTSVKFLNMYFIRNGDNGKIIIYPVLYVNKDYDDKTNSVKIRGDNPTTYKSWNITNTYNMLNKHMNKVENINKFSGVFMGPPFEQLMASLLGTTPQRRTISDPIDDVWVENIDDNKFLYLEAPSIMNIKMILYEYGDDYKLIRPKCLDGLNSLETYYSYVMFYDKVITNKELISGKYILANAKPLENNIHMTYTISKDGIKAYSSFDDGFFGTIKETWLSGYPLPSTSDNYNKYVSSIMSATDNGIRQINQQRYFGVRQSHFNETEKYVNNATSLMGMGADVIAKDMSVTQPISTVSSMIAGPRHGQATRKKINMGADNQLKAIKASFEDASRTLQQSVNMSNIDTLMLMDSVSTHGGPYFEMIKYSYQLSKTDEKFKLISYFLYHFYNGYMCDVTTTFSEIMNDRWSSDDIGMFVFRLNKINIDEYVNINYTGLTLYEKQLIGDIFAGVVRVWDTQPSIEKVNGIISNYLKAQNNG